MKIKRIFFFPLVAILFAFGGLSEVFPSNANQEAALQAEEMLSPMHWAQALKIENKNRMSRYPATVYGTVFEFQNLLWFYTKTGTQPLRASASRIEEFKENLLPLLQTMEPGFASFEPLVSEKPFDVYASLQNGCVVESIYSFGDRQEQGEPILEAKLLLYTSRNAIRSPGAKHPTGHAVLVYKTPSGTFFVDPPKIESTGEFRKATDWDAKKMAGEIESHYGAIEIKNAFFEPFEMPLSTVASRNGVSP